jgi:peptidoglycan/LPS O-acetylase OafA/YrhL
LIEKGQVVPKGNRIYFLDNLRTFMIFLVVLYHAGGVYDRIAGITHSEFDKGQSF